MRVRDSELPAAVAVLHDEINLPTYCSLIFHFPSPLPRYLQVIRLLLQIHQNMRRGVVYFIFQSPRFCCCLPVRICVIIMSLLGILLSGLLSVVLWFEVSRAYVP